MASSTAAARGDVASYAAELERIQVNFPGLTNEEISQPKRWTMEPYLWKWSDLRPLVVRSADYQESLPQGQTGAERRILRLHNPGVLEETVTDTMSVSVQYLLPGEVARNHRHVASAFRFFIEGSAYTTVNGEKTEMRRGDLIITPFREWHDHGNESDAPAIWMDGLDYPLVRYLEAKRSERSDETQQPTGRTGYSTRRYGTVGLRPYGYDEDIDTERRSLLHFPWEATYKALRGMADAADVTPHDDVIFQYVNPATGRGVFPTIACCAQMIRPGVRTRSHRHTGSAVYHVVEGQGETVIDGEVFTWQQGDFLVVPPRRWHEHANSSREPAVLFSIQDFPALRALGMYHEEAA